MRLVTALKWFCAVALIAGALSVAAYATTPAGTIIKNQASASYRDSNGVLRTATSNLVETLIQQVAAFELLQSQSRIAATGQQIFFAHTLTNTGNGTDSFVLSVTNTVGDDFDYTNLAIYDDSDQDGQPDNFNALTVSPGLGMQQQWHFVVAASIPPGLASADTGVLTLTAQSQLNAAVTATNTDTSTVSADAVIELSKALSATSGASPSGQFTVTLSYRNTGSAVATDVVLIDALPAGMTYVAGSGRWSESVGTVLSDANPADAQGSGATITYCAYDGSCTGLPEAQTDIDGDSSNQVTATIASVAPGDAGTVTFSVTVDAGLETQSLVNTAEFEYTTGGSVQARQLTNSVAFIVQQAASVVVNGSGTVATDLTAEPSVVASMAQATAVTFDNYIWNTGNGIDTFDLSFDPAASANVFPAGTLFRFLQQDGLTPLIDTSGNGIPDTGPLPAGEFYKVVVQAIPPANAVGNNGGAGYELGTVATSVFDPSQSNAMLNRLLTITAATVDITHVDVVADTDSLGDGSGPETDAVISIDANPGDTITIDLYINNTGSSPSSLDLAASTVDDFATIELPADWQIEYRLDGEAELVTNTGVINPGEHVLVQASVSIPPTQTGGEVSLYFRALAESTGSLDIIHDTINVIAEQQLLLVTDQSGQADRGGSFTYHHSLSSIGNVAVNDIQLSTQDSESGWTSVIYEDTDGSGDLTAADTAITSISSLAPGEVASLFVRVFVPSSAELLSVNNTVLTASWNAGADSVVVTDATRVTETELSIVKEQAPDLGCDGSIDGSYGVASFSVEPGNNCVSYRLTASNDGSSTVYNVDIADATPAFTSYNGAATCSQAGCSVTEPANGGYGNIIATMPSLLAGASVVLTFSVRVE